MKLSFIVPTLNELKNVPLVVELIQQTMMQFEYEFEVLFVDDQSTDGTLDEISRFSKGDQRLKLILSPERKGLGHALKLGMKEASGDLVLFLDCDVSIRKDDLLSLIKNAGPEKMLIGSRYVKGGKTIGAPVVKVFMSKCLNGLMSRYLSVPAIDISHSLRVFPKNKVKLPTSDTHPAFFWELSLLGHRGGLKVCEVPVTFRERVYGKSKNATRKMIKSVLKGIETLVRLKVN